MILHLRRALICCLAVAFLLAPVLSIASAKDVRLVIAAFSEGDLKPWKPRRFSGETDYRLVQEKGRGRVLKAHSRNAASGLIRSIRIDLDKTPYLHWSWKIGDTIHKVDERLKSGDDYAARLYVVSSGGLFFWQTRVLDYVWSSAQPVGTYWPNAYTKHAVMLAVESGRMYRGQWRTYKRNLRDDLRRYLGRDIRYIDAVAVMTDTDNTGQQVTAWYGDIYATAE